MAVVHETRVECREHQGVGRQLKGRGFGDSLPRLGNLRVLDLRQSQRRRQVDREDLGRGWDDRRSHDHRDLRIGRRHRTEPDIELRTLPSRLSPERTLEVASPQVGMRKVLEVLPRSDAPP